jgi:hypothetical protein
MTNFPLNLKKALETSRLDIFIQQEEARGVGPATDAEVMNAIDAIASSTAPAEAPGTASSTGQIDEKSDAELEPRPASPEGQPGSAAELPSQPSASMAGPRRRTLPSAA